MTEKIRPEQSIYVGTLFSLDDMNNKRFFKFGKVYSPMAYVSSLINVKHPTLKDESRVSSSPDRTADAEFEHQDDQSLIESKPNSVVRNPFVDDLDTSNSSGYKKNKHQERFLLELNNENIIPEIKKSISYREPCTSVFLTQFRELNDRISSRLDSRLNQVKGREADQRDLEKDLESPGSSPFKILHTNLQNHSNNVFEYNSQLGKRRGHFENDASNEYIKKRIEGTHRNGRTGRGLFDIYGMGFDIEKLSDINSKLKKIDFEVKDADDDARPIRKKIKAMASRVKEEEDVQQWEKEVILEYKPNSERQSSIVVYGRDLQRLDQNSYLNDTLIHFYLKFVQNELMEESRRDSVHIFNTFFLERLRGSNKSDKFDFEKGYNNVKKWTKDVDIFEKDFLIFPMNDRSGKHWNLFVLCYPRYFLEKSEYRENGRATGLTKPFLLYFDSMNVLSQKTDIPKLISCYMEYELMDKKPVLYNKIKAHFNTITEDRICQVIVPFQENLYDCGIYMLEYAEKFLTEPQEILNDITMNKDKLSLFPKSIFRNKRADIAGIILNLAKGDQNVAREYQKNRQARIEASKKDSDEYDIINDEDTINFLNDELNVRYEDLLPEQRAHVKLIVYKQAHENQLARLVANNSSKLEK